MAAAAMVTAAVAVGVTGIAAADDGAATPAPDEAAQLIGWKGNEDLWRRENQLGELNDFIAELPGIDGSGYIESVNDPDRMAKKLLWHGPANPIQQAIKDEAHRLGITVTVE